jgi:hypothetical protein
MKIAVLFSGRINDDTQQYENIMNILVSHHHADFFICYQKDSNPEVVNNVISLYQPKKIMGNDEIYFPVDKYPSSPESRPHRIMCMYKSRYLLRNLFQEYIEETKTEYDIVISTRMDMFYEDNTMLGEYQLPYIQQNIILIPEYWDCMGINDQIAVGNQNTILNYLNVYDSLHGMLEAGVFISPEFILWSYLQFKDQQIVRYPAKYHIERRFNELTNGIF